MKITELPGCVGDFVVLSTEQALSTAAEAYRTAKPNARLGLNLRIVEQAYDMQRDAALKSGGVDLADAGRQPGVETSGGFDFS